MKRALILIGVHKTGGGLQPLRAVGDCIASMEQWAKRQGIPPELIASLDDFDDRKVTVSAILDATKEFGDGSVEQLIVYFAGHGFVGSLGEYWLLSDAPEDGNAAVNVYGSELAARSGIFPHVVFISDACRVSTKTVRESRVPGGLIFLNFNLPGPSKSVDQFFAALLGQPAFEVKIDEVYRSIYTATLVEALNGRYKEILEVDPREGATVLRPRPLKNFLPGEISRRLREAGVDLPEDGAPDAIIASEPTSWIAAFGSPIQLSGGEDFMSPTGPGQPPPVRPSFIPAQGFSLQSDSFTQRVDDLLSGGEFLPEAPFVARWTQLAKVQIEASRKFTTKCGLVITGAKIKDVKDSFDSAFPLTDVDVQIKGHNNPTSVLIQLTSGNGVLVPAFPGYVGHLRFAEGGLLEGLSFEPAQNTSAWGFFEEKASQLRALREVFDIAAQKRTPRLDKLSQRSMKRLESVMHYQDGIDFTLAVLAAYAYLVAHLEEKIPRLWARTVRALRAAPFDIKMFLPEGLSTLATAGPMPPFPLYAQGWAFMSALQKELPPGLETLRNHVESATWTTVDPEGVAMISEFLDSDRSRFASRFEIPDPFVVPIPGRSTTADDVLRPAESDIQIDREEEELGA